MKPFADTNFFTNLWLPLRFSLDAQSLASSVANQSLQFPVTFLLEAELTNALQRLVFETRHGFQGLHITPEAALLARHQFEEELAIGEMLEWKFLPESELSRTYQSLVYRHTAQHGFRTYDILHVSTALCLGCDTFWSFDQKAKQLATLEGMETNAI